MAISAIERTNIVKLVVSMFNAAPGATYLAELVTAYEAIGGTTLQKLSSLAISLGNTNVYKQLNPASQTASEFATEFLSPFGLEDNREAFDLVVGRINAGVSKGQIAFEATVALNNSTAPAFAEARAILNNKAMVAEYFSITKAIPQTDLAQLQLVVADVDANPDSVIASKAAIDSGTGSVGFMLTAAAVSVEEAGTAIFELVLDKAPTSDITVNYTTKIGTASGADFEAEAGSVTFSAGQTIAFVTVKTTNDSIVETNETFTIEISGGQLTAPVVATATITDSADNQEPDAGVKYTLTASTVAVEEGVSATFELTLDKAPTTDVSVIFSTKTGTATFADFEGQAGSVTFAVGQKKAFITVNTIDDTLVEATEGFTLELSGEQLTAPVSATATIADTADIAASAAVVKLTTGVDDLTGSALADIFSARVVQNINGQQVNQLGSGDQVNGSGGIDTLNAKITAGSFVQSSGNASMPIQPETTSVEIIKLQAVSADISTDASNFGDNNTQIYVNAKEMTGVQQLFSSYSDADLIIQNLTTIGLNKLSDMTIGMAYTGNADSRWDESDYSVYFDQDYLTPVGTSSRPFVNIDVMNEDAFDISGGLTPLKGVFFREFIIKINGSSFSFSVDTRLPNPPEFNLLGESFANGKGNEIQTYQQLEDAVKLGIQKLIAANPTVEALKSLTAELVGTFEADANPATLIRRVGESLQLSVEGRTNGIVNILTVVATDLELARPANTDILNNNRFERATDTPSTPSDILAINVVLEKAGLAGDGGDLIIGSMNKTHANEWDAVNSVTDTTTSGIKQFDIIVKGGQDKSSSLAGLHSTNNNLKVVTVKTDPTQVGPFFADLTIGNSNTGDGDDILETLDTTPGTFIDNLIRLPSLDNALALKDVQTFDASLFKGDLSLYAALTDEVVAKYLNIVDQAPDAPALDNVAFVYTGGTGNDYFNIAVDTTNFAFEGSVTREDMTINVIGGEGNDTIVLAMVDDEPNDDMDNGGGNDFTPQLAMPDDSDVNPFIVNHFDNLTLGGDSDGNLENWYINQSLLRNVRIEGGAGNDTIWKPGSGDVIIDGGTGTDTVYADNTGDKADWVLNYRGSSFSTNDIGSGINHSYNLFKTGVVVNFLGFESKKIAIVDTKGVATDLNINQAVKNAINSDPVLSKLLLAQDGPANSLVVTSLIDGEQVRDNLTVNLVAPTAAEITAGEALNLVNFYGAAAGGTTPAAFATYLGGIVTAFNDDALNDTYLIEIDDEGTDSIHTSDNNINGGTLLFNDVLVLGTGEFSNDAVAYKGLNNGTDTIVNFDSTFVDGTEVTLPVPGEPESFTVTFANLVITNPGTATTVTFEDSGPITLDDGVISASLIPASDVAFAFANGYNDGAGTDFTVTYVPGTAQVTFVRTVNGNTPDTVPADFVFTNATGTPTISAYMQGVDDFSPAVEADATVFTVDYNGTVVNDGVAGDFTYDGATINTVVGDGPITLAQKVAAATFTSWTTVDNLNGTVTFTARTPGVQPSPTAAQLGDDNGTMGAPAQQEVFTVDFAGTNAAAGDTVSFDGVTTAALAAGDGAMEVAAAIVAADAFDTSWIAVDNLDGTATFTRTIAGPYTPDVVLTDFVLSGAGVFIRTVTLDQDGSNATADEGIDAVVSTNNVGSAAVPQMGTEETVVIPPGPSSGTDFLDFSGYTGNIDVVAVFVNGILVTNTAATAGQEYVTLTEGATGVYTISLFTENGLAADTTVGLIGVADFGASQTFTAANFIL